MVRKGLMYRSRAESAFFWGSKTALYKFETTLRVVLMVKVFQVNAKQNTLLLGRWEVLVYPALILFWIFQ